MSARRQAIPSTLHAVRSLLLAGTTALLLVTASLFSWNCHLFADNVANPQPRPNIVLILADDKYDQFQMEPTFCANYD